MSSGNSSYNSIYLFYGVKNEIERNGREYAFYYYNDHLGSAAYLTDDCGQVTQTLNYLPYGEDWVDIQNNLDPRLGQYTFNGKEKDWESGFHYYGARYYWSEVLTGWLSVDPMVDKYPSISSYAYCAWNPIRLIDPHGEEAMDDWYKNDRTGSIGWHEGHAKQIVGIDGDTYTNIGESYSKPIENGHYKNYYQNCLITQGEKQDASKLAYKNKAVRAMLLSNKSPLPTSHKKDLFNSNVASRGMSTPDMLGVQVSGNLFVGGGASIDLSVGYIKGDGMYGSLAISPGSGFDISGSVGVCIGSYNGLKSPSKENYAGLSYNISAGAGSVFYQHSTSNLKGNGWNVSTFGVSAGTEIFFGGSFGVSHTKVW